MNGVVVTDLLPGALEYEESTLDPGLAIDYDDDNNSVKFTIGALDTGDTVYMTVKVTVDSGTDLDSITNRARLEFFEGPRIITTETIDLTGSADSTLIAATLTSIPLTATAAIPISLPIGYPTNLPTTGLQAIDLMANPALPAGLAVAVVALIIGLALIVVALRTRGKQHGNHVSAGIVSIIALLFVAVGLISGSSVIVALQQPSTSITQSVAQVAVQPTVAPTDTLAPTDTPTIDTTSEATSSGRRIVDIAKHTTTKSSGAQSGSSQLPPGLSLAEWMAGFKPPGKPATHIVIPALNVDQNLVEAPIIGSTWDVTQFTHEIAHLQGTAYPGTLGNAVVAGHVTYVGGAGPFRHLDQLNPGDIILAKGDDVVYRYVVQSVETVGISDVGVTAPTAGANLTLITCTDWDASARAYTQRLVVHAVLRPGGARS
jgi:LPXTG-site transpeptidase (sortase) family protein